MKLSAREKAILYGFVLGDGFLQKTGRHNARLRIEHSEKQREYIEWKYRELQTVFAHKPKKIVRMHPKTQQQYTYLRLQSHSSPFLGELRKVLYDGTGKRRISEGIKKFVSSPISIAVWYMDDGYYYVRDKSAHIYLPKFSRDELNRLIHVLYALYAIQPKWYCRPDRMGCQLNFTGVNKEKLFTLIAPYIIPSLKYKLPLTP